MDFHALWSLRTYLDHSKPKLKNHPLKQFKHMSHKEKFEMTLHFLSISLSSICCQFARQSSSGWSECEPPCLWIKPVNFPGLSSAEPKLQWQWHQYPYQLHPISSNYILEKSKNDFRILQAVQAATQFTRQTNENIWCWYENARGGHCRVGERGVMVWAWRACMCS